MKVSSNRGYIKAKAVVTKRIRTLKANGKDIDTIGIPIHWGYEGVAKKGFIANTLTPFVGDANTQTPEFKSFLVNVERCNGDDIWLINLKISFVVPRLTVYPRASGAGLPGRSGNSSTLPPVSAVKPVRWLVQSGTTFAIPSAITLGCTTTPMI